MSNVYRFRRLKHGEPKKFRVPAHFWQRQRRGRYFPFRLGALTLPIALLLAGAAGLGYYSNNLGARLLGPLAGCHIKGNVSPSGERIYHVPGQEFYDTTRISLLRGERWFCSEAEAREAGWRRSKV